MSRNLPPATSQPQIILALDVDNLMKAKYLVNKLYPKIKIFKVGPPLFMAAGPKIIQFIHKIGAEVFLDLKFFDIPHTVANSLRQAVALKVKMLTLHILGGKDMLKIAVQTVKQEASRLKIKRPFLIGVTVLTSQSASGKDVLRLAKLGLNCGLDGIVCSVREAKLLRKKIRQKFVMVVAGIRPQAASGDDQKRIATAKEAREAGADFMVVGRPILKAKDPLKAVKELI